MTLDQTRTLFEMRSLTGICRVAKFCVSEVDRVGRFFQEGRIMPYAQNGAVKVYYDCYGQGTPIVFLHPWTTNGGIWYYQAFPFAKTNQVVVVDHRGHGRSDKPQSGYSIQEHASDVRAVLDAVGAQKAVLVGNSIGGMIAMQFALDNPDRVKGLLILSSGTGLGENMPKEAAAAFKSNFE